MPHKSVCHACKTLVDHDSLPECKLTPCGLYKDHPVIEVPEDSELTYEGYRESLQAAQDAFLPSMLAVEAGPTISPPLWSESEPEQLEFDFEFPVIEEIAEEATKRLVVSDGGSTSYYELPEDASELNDLIEHKNMPFARGNIFKACYRMGEKSNTDALYDINKIIFFAERMRGALLKGQAI